jgi:hypothetical protein
MYVRDEMKSIWAVRSERRNMEKTLTIYRCAVSLRP